MALWLVAMKTPISVNLCTGYLRVTHCLRPHFVNHFWKVAHFVNYSVGHYGLKWVGKIQFTPMIGRNQDIVTCEGFSFGVGGWVGVGRTEVGVVTLRWPKLFTSNTFLPFDLLVLLLYCSKIWLVLVNIKPYENLQTFCCCSRLRATFLIILLNIFQAFSQVAADNTNGWYSYKPEKSFLVSFVTCLLHFALTCSIWALHFKFPWLLAFCHRFDTCEISRITSYENVTTPNFLYSVVYLHSINIYNKFITASEWRETEASLAIHNRHKHLGTFPIKIQ